MVGRLVEMPEGGRGRVWILNAIAHSGTFANSKYEELSHSRNHLVAVLKM